MEHVEKLKSALPDTPSQQESYRKLTKALMVLGGAQFGTQAIGVARAKIAALLIGPAGIGLQGAFVALYSMLGNICGLGLRSSSVRDIAMAHASGDKERLAEIVTTVRRMAFLTGSAGMVFMFLAARPLSHFILGSEDYAAEIMLLSPMMLLTSIYLAQQAVLQGLREIVKLGQRQLLSAVSCTVVSAFMFFFWGMKGIIWVLLLNGVLDCLITWQITRKIRFPNVKPSWWRSFSLSKEMFQLGISLTLTLFFYSASILFAKAFISRHGGLEELGFYQAAYTVSFMTFCLVVSTISSDYYPRLVNCIVKNEPLGVLINNLIEIIFLLGFPLLLGMYIFAKPLLLLLYSSAFLKSTPLLCLFVLGSCVRLFSYPLTFIPLAYKRSIVVIAVEFSLFGVFLLSCWLLGGIWGVVGVVMASVVREIASFAFYRILALKNFSWHSQFYINLLLMFIGFLLGTGIVFIENMTVAIVGGIILEVIVCIYCLRKLIKYVGADHPWVGKLLRIPGMNYIISSY